MLHGLTERRISGEGDNAVGFFTGSLFGSAISLTWARSFRDNLRYKGSAKDMAAYYGAALLSIPLTLLQSRRLIWLIAGKQWSWRAVLLYFVTALGIVFRRPVRNTLQGHNHDKRYCNNTSPLFYIN